MFQFFIFFVIGTLMILYKRTLVDEWFGRSSWAERVFGPTGTYTMWFLLGLITIFGGMLFGLGILKWPF